MVAAATHPDAHARHVNTDPRLSVLLGTILVVLSRSLIMTVLLNNNCGLVMMTVLLNNNGRSVMMLFPAIAMLVTNHLDVQHAIIDVRNANGKWSCLGSAHEQNSGSARQKRKPKFVHIHSSQVYAVFDYQPWPPPPKP